LETEYVVQRTGHPWEARVISSGRQVAEIRKGEGADFILDVAANGVWTLSPRVHGEIRPFSMKATRSHGGGGTDSMSELTVRDNIFLHDGKCYMLTNAAEGRPLKQFLSGAKYICRLENFSVSDLEDVDHVTRSTLRKYRGKAVGELKGIGNKGHVVKLSEELADVGLLLAAVSYLLYASV
jgi:hypothetical protein